MPIRDLLRPLIPAAVRRARINWLHQREARRLADLPVVEAFSQIYERGLWGGEPDEYFSGFGSRDPRIVIPYVESVRAFADSFQNKLDAVDLGCGDFSVGAQIRSGFDAYRAYDVVPAVIDQNKRKYDSWNVEFGCLDIVEQPLPPGDVVLLRQVLQHLSNAQIAPVVPKLTNYRYVIITEHLPGTADFRANLDMAMGKHMRAGRAAKGRGEDSGIVLTAPPFSLPVVSERILCEVADPFNTGTIIRTTLYEPSYAAARIG
jgi:hypothetical protein